MPFAHLHVHNEFSVLDGVGTSKQYAEEAAKKGFKHLAITNHGNIDGWPKHQKECLEKEINPVLGCEFYIVDDASIKEKGDKKNHVCIYARTDEGAASINRLLTFANLKGFYYRPRIDTAALLENTEGLAISSACKESLIYCKTARKQLGDIIDAVGRKNFVFEVMPHPFDWQVNHNMKVQQIARKYDCKIVATNDCHYVKPSDSILQEVLLAVQTKRKWSDKDRWRFETAGLHLRSEKKMEEAFEKQRLFEAKQIKLYLKNAFEFAAGFDFRVKKIPVVLPLPDKYKGQDEDKLLKKLAMEGFERRFGKEMGRCKEVYQHRFKSEFELIKEKNFSRYFIIVYDLLRWCDSQHITYGPRGSVGGSLTAYLLGITAIDPLKYDLLFSRFIAPDRVDFPDIDIDFEDVKREEVRRYLITTYGSDRVAGVSTVLRAKARYIIRDVSRVFEVPQREVDEFCKTIDRLKYADLEDKEEIEEAAASQDGRRFAAAYPEVLDYATRLTGQVRSYGQHAGAIVVASEDLRTGKQCNLALRGGGAGTVVVNWDMSEIENFGLLKLDVLGLNTWTILNNARKQIEKRDGKRIEFEDIDLEDKNLFEMINRQETAGIFQLQTDLLTSWCKEIGIERFGNIVDAIALVRPGPLDSGMAEEYVRRKKGGEWEEKNPIYEKITKDTYGVIVYQEQIMAVVNKVAGLSYTDADKIRKVIGKKRDAKEFLPFEKKFIDGCVKNKTMTKEEAEEFWEGLQSWASYAFNKSHAVAYAMVAMWTAFFKYYYPVDFITCSLSWLSHSAKPEDKQVFVDEARRMGLIIMPPKVGKSDKKVWFAEGDKIYMPFTEVKGFGEKTAEKVANGSITKRAATKKKKLFDVAIAKGEEEGKKSKVEKVLDAINAFDLDGACSREAEEEYFDVSFGGGGLQQMYPKLYKLFGDEKVEVEKAVRGEQMPQGVKLILRRQASIGRVLKCKRCELVEEAEGIVTPPSSGKYNVAIIGEAPGRNEWQKGKGFVGKSGNMLWEALGRDGFRREQFHITNVNKCFPAESRTPNRKQIKMCGSWLAEELKQLRCKLALAMGNNAVMFFKNQQGGIRGLSGKVEWIEKYGLWVVWCVHPSFVMRNLKENGPFFERGIEAFKDMLHRMKASDRRLSEEER